MKIYIIFPYRETTEERKVNGQFILDHYKKLPVDEEVIFTISDDDGNSDFNRGRALHNGYCRLRDEIAPDDILIFADNDLYVDHRTLSSAISLAQEFDTGYVVPFSSICYLDEKISRQARNGVTLRQGGYYRGSRLWNNKSTGGINVLRAENYERSGGFEPKFSSWGFEDAAFDAQMQCLVGPCIWLNHRAFHLHHPKFWSFESKEYKEGKELCDLYRAAIKDPEEMRRLIMDSPRNWER